AHFSKTFDGYFSTRPCAPDEEKRREDEDTNHISYPPRAPCGIIRGKSYDLPQPKTGHSKRGTDEGTEGHGKQHQEKDVPELVQSMAKAIPLEQIGPDKGFQGIADADAHS